MEVWILLAAAGSGYLARRWQNAQKVKGTSSDEVDPHDNSAYSSTQLTSTRGRYRHFSSINRRQGGKSLCGKRANQWGRLPYKHAQAFESIPLQNVLEHKSDERVDMDGREIRISSEVHVVSNDGSISSGSNLASSSVIDKSIEFSDNVTADCVVQPVLGYEISKSVSEPSTVQEDSTAQPLAGCRNSTCEEGQSGLGKSNVTEWGQATNGRGLGGTDGLMSRSSSGKRLNVGSSEKDVKSGCFIGDGYSGKRIKDASESMVRQEEPYECAGTWMPGFWDVSEGIFVLDSDSLLVQQESEARRRGNNTRKVKTPNKSGRSKGSMCRRKNLTTQKPMSSLESCLSAQLDENYKHLKTDGFPLPFGSPCREEHEQPIGARRVSLDEPSPCSVESGKMSPEGKINVESVIGLPSLSSRPSRRSSLKTPKEIESFAEIAAKGRASRNPFEGKKCVRHDSSSPGTSAGYESIVIRDGTEVVSSNGGRTDRNCSKGVARTSEGLLFNFGVGVGMMFTIMSNKREVKKLTKLLREAECLIKDLEAELQGRDGLGLECGSSCNNAEEDNTVERRQSVLSCTLKKVRSASHLLNGTRVSLTEESEPVSGIELEQSEDISQLEAELEAELERMELNLNDGNISKHRRRCSSSSELDVDVSVKGELTAEGLPCEVEVESEIEDGNDSTHEDLLVSNHTVSPRELAKRLHEVLETRLEERIAELEAELKLMGGKLQVQADELQWWRDQTLFSTEVDEGGIFPKLSQKHDKNFETTNGTKESVDRRMLATCQVEEQHLPSPVRNGSPNAYPVLPGIIGGIGSHDLKNGPSRSPLNFKKVSNSKNPVFITLAGEALAAYNEACDEFSKVSSDPDIGANLSANSGGIPENNCIQKVDLPVKDYEIDRLGSSDLCEQVDLLSLAEDFYIDGNSEFMVQMSEFCKAPPKGRKCSVRGSSKKGIMSSHPEPEQSLAISKGVDSSDDATNDTSGSTPCSVKFIDGSTVGFCDSDDVSKSKVEADCSKSSYADWSETVFVHAGANTPVVNCQEGDHSLHFNESFDIKPSDRPSCGEIASNPGDWMLPEDGDHTSDLDDPSGQLLIKRIVEKSRKGAPILQDVQTVLNSFERSQTSFSDDRSNAKV